MFVILFVVSFALAFGLSFGVAWISADAIESVLHRFVHDAVIREAFSKYFRFAIVVVGISMGTQVRPLQEYMGAPYSTKVSMLAGVTQEYWVMEIYHTIAGTLEGLVWLLFFTMLVALMAPTIMRWAKLEPPRSTTDIQKSGDSQSSGTPN